MIVCRFRFAKELEQLPWSKKDRRYFLTGHEEYVGALRAATQIWIKMTKGDITVEDALVIRIMNDFPGGIELHIGVRLSFLLHWLLLLSTAVKPFYARLALELPCHMRLI